MAPGKGDEISANFSESHESTFERSLAEFSAGRNRTVSRSCVRVANSGKRQVTPARSARFARRRLTERQGMRTGTGKKDRDISRGDEKRRRGNELDWRRKQREQGRLIASGAVAIPPFVRVYVCARVACACQPACLRAGPTACELRNEQTYGQPARL